MSDKPKLRVVGKEPHEHIVIEEDPKPVNTDVIASMTALLDAAKKGDLLGFAAVLSLSDDYMSMDFVGESISYQTIGGLESLKLDILAELQDDDE